MFELIVIVAILTLVEGSITAYLCGEKTWSAWGYPTFAPNQVGCLLAAIGGVTLCVLGLMYLGSLLL